MLKEQNRVVLKKYVSRFSFLLKRCQNRSVLHFGCAQYLYTLDKIKQGNFLHQKLATIASELYGIDFEPKGISLLKELSYENVFDGDVENPDSIAFQRIFDVVLAGDIIEHLSRPGAMLETAKRFMSKSSELIITTNNQFSLHANISFSLGSFKEGINHVCVFSIPTLNNLLNRHGFTITEAYGAYDRKPVSFLEKINFYIGVPILKLCPNRAGTLIVVAKLK